MEVSRGVKKHEEAWLSIFRNDSLRADPELLYYINMIIQNEFYIDIEKDENYHIWLDKMFFLDRTGLYKLNALIKEYTEKKTEDAETTLKGYCNELIQSFSEFKQGRNK